MKEKMSNVLELLFICLSINIKDYTVAFLLCLGQDWYFSVCFLLF